MDRIPVIRRVMLTDRPPLEALAWSAVAVAVPTARHSGPKDFPAALGGRMEAIKRATDLLTAGGEAQCDLERLVAKPERKVFFRRAVLQAYEERCAVTRWRRHAVDQRELGRAAMNAWASSMRRKE